MVDYHLTVSREGSLMLKGPAQMPPLIKRKGLDRNKPYHKLLVDCLDSFPSCFANTTVEATDCEERIKQTDDYAFAALEVFFRQKQGQASKLLKIQAANKNKVKAKDLDQHDSTQNSLYAFLLLADVYTDPYRIPRVCAYHRDLPDVPDSPLLRKGIGAALVVATYETNPIFQHAAQSIILQYTHNIGNNAEDPLNPTDKTMRLTAYLTVLKLEEDPHSDISRKAIRLLKQELGETSVNAMLANDGSVRPEFLPGNCGTLQLTGALERS